MLVLSEFQENIASNNNQPYIQDWFPAVNFKNYNLQIGQAAIFHQNTNIKLKDVVGIAQFSQFSEFRLIAYQNYSNNNLIAWVNPTSYNALGYPTNINAPIAITTVGINYNFNPTFQNLNLLSAGEYWFTQYFVIQGKDSLGNWIDISSYNYRMNLNVYSQQVVYSPATLIFNHNQGVATPTQSVTVSGNYWSLTVPSSIVPIQPVVGVSFSNSNGFTIVSGGGTKTIQFGLNDTFFDTQNASTIPLLQVISLEGSGVGSQPQLTVGIECNIFVLDANTLTCDVSSLNFSAIKSFQEPQELTGFVGGTAIYTIIAPSWLIVTPGNILNQNVLYGNISFVPIPTASMQPGTYVGNVILQYTSGGNLQQIIIPVTYILTGVLNNPFANKTNGFTLDVDYFEFSSNEIDTYIEINTEVKTYDRTTNIPTIKSATDILPLFQGAGKICFNERVHKLMEKLSIPNDSFFQYKQAEFSLTAIEKKLVDNSVVRNLSGTFNKFIAGVSKYTDADTTFLILNNFPIRVTSQGYAIVSFFAKKGNYNLTILKNNTIDNVINLGYLNDGVYSKKIVFDQYRQGDFISINLDESSVDNYYFAHPNFIVFPKNRYSHFISWENKFLTESVFEFTGGFSLKSDIERTETKRLVNFVEVLEVLKSRKTSNFIINTGWILKTDTETMDSLMMASRIWLKYNSEYLELRAVSKSQIAYDSERELIDVAIEFQINKKSNEENYSF